MKCEFCGEPATIVLKWRGSLERDTLLCAACRHKHFKTRDRLRGVHEEALESTDIKGADR